MRPDVRKEYRRETGREVIENFPYWEPCHKIVLGNGIMGWDYVGGDVDEVNGMRVTIAGWPIKWQGGGDGSMARPVAIVDARDH
jgi:kynurenine formamidase